MKKLFKKVTWKNVMGKVSIATMTGLGLFSLPRLTSAAGTAPSEYVNKISDSLFGEILRVAPKIALVVIGFSLLMYFVVGEDHKKSKYKGSATVAIIAYLILLVLDPLLAWMDGILG